MSQSKLRRRAAGAMRGVYNRVHLPWPIEKVLRRLAHIIHPHVLRCRLCGAEFVAPSALSKLHAERAYDHYVTVHDRYRSDAANPSTTPKET